MRKVVFCDNSLKELINFRGDVIESYAADGFEVVLVAPLNCDYRPTYSNIRHIPLEMDRSGMNPLNEMRYFWTLFRIYRREQPDYIFHYTIKPNIYGSMAARLCGIRSTAIVAGLGYVFNNGGLGNRLARCLYRFAMRFPEHIFVLNVRNRDLLLKERIATSHQLILLPGGEGINLVKYKTASI